MAREIMGGFLVGDGLAAWHWQTPLEASYTSERLLHVPIHLSNEALELQVICMPHQQ